MRTSDTMQSGRPPSGAAAERRLTRIVTTRAPEPGFGGAGHEAVYVLDPQDFGRQDPFILLADDRLDLPAGSAVGGEHPHAGFETVTFVLDGALNDRDEGVLRAGDIQWMTAGRGIIHGEQVVPVGRTRVLQLWLALPPDSRWAEPRSSTLAAADAPARREAGAEARFYVSGAGAPGTPGRTHLPVTVVDVQLQPGAAFALELPASHTAFAYVLDGEARVGADGTPLRAAQVGWLDRSDHTGASVLRLSGGPVGARLVVYAGQPQHTPIVVHGPFVGGTRADIARASRDYLDGKFPRLSAVVAARVAHEVV